MNNTMEYKGYVGSVEFSEEDVIFYGKVMGIRSLISYEGENARELVEGFHEAVDEYLLTCEQQGKVPEQAYKVASMLEYHRSFIRKLLYMQRNMILH